MARIKVADLKFLLKQWNQEEISFSFMVQKLNEIAEAKEGWCSEPVECDICTKKWAAVYPNGTESLECPNCSHKNHL